MSNGSAGKREFLDALRPVASALGAELVAKTKLRGSDVELRWQGEVVGGLRLPNLRDALPRLIEQVEREHGAPLRDLSREGKQRVVRQLEERGAFNLRKAVEEVADAMGVSRMTIYTYLDAIQRAGVEV